MSINIRKCGFMGHHNMIGPWAYCHVYPCSFTLPRSRWGRKRVCQASALLGITISLQSFGFFFQHSTCPLQGNQHRYHDLPMLLKNRGRLFCFVFSFCSDSATSMRRFPLLLHLQTLKRMCVPWKFVFKISLIYVSAVYFLVLNLFQIP